MRELTIKLPPHSDERQIVQAIDMAARELGLKTVSKGSLGLYPGCTHWHFKLSEQTGTIEITYWPSEARAWFALRANRYAKWMDEVVPQLKADIERWLVAKPSKMRA
jgi:hypothetical protein